MLDVDLRNMSANPITKAPTRELTMTLAFPLVCSTSPAADDMLDDTNHRLDAMQKEPDDAAGIF
jgi:hypothetical protein